MTTMLDKLASAIEPLIPDSCHQKDHAEEVSRKIARAALQAMREVDERSSVFYDGLSAMGGYNDSGPVEPWQAMIDAILNEKA